MCIETCGVLVWQVVDGYVHSIDFHHHVTILRVQINISAAEMNILCRFINMWMDENCSLFFCCYGNSHISKFHIDLVLFNVILLQQNHEFQLICAILCQNLVARQRHLVLVFPAVECGQYVFVEATFS